MCLQPHVLEPTFIDSMAKFGMVEFDYVQIGRAPQRPISTKRFEQILSICQLDQMGPSMGVRTMTPPGTSLSSEDKRRPPGSPDARATPTRAKGNRSRGDASEKVEKVSPFPPLRQFTRALFSELETMKSQKNYLHLGESTELNRVVELRSTGTGDLDTQSEPVYSDAVDDDGLLVSGDDPIAFSQAAKTPESSEQPHSQSGQQQQEEPAPSEKRSATDSENRAAMVIKRGGKATCTARRLLYNLQWLLALRWVSAQQAVQLLSMWPTVFEGSRVELVCVLFDRLADLHNFNGILSALSDAEAAQCFYRFGWLNIWTPLLPDNYYELNLAVYEEREVSKALVRLAIDEPGENWQGETFGWSREELIPGWELNMSWLKDGGFPEKGYLCLEYYSGADKGCGPVWPTRRELASGTLCGLPEDDLDEITAYVDSLSLVPGGYRRR